MGDWYEIPNPPYFRYDPDAPTPGQSPAVTQMFNATPSPAPRRDDVDPDAMPPEDEHAHGGDE